MDFLEFLISIIDLYNVLPSSVWQSAMIASDHSLSLLRNRAGCEMEKVEKKVHELLEYGPVSENLRLDQSLRMFRGIIIYTICISLYGL